MLYLNLGQGAKDFIQLRDQLRLALTWNRSDVAEEKIFTDTTMWPQGISFLLIV